MFLRDKNVVKIFAEKNTAHVLCAVGYVRKSCDSEERQERR
jgi:hypothetical protein